MSSTTDFAPIQLLPLGAIIQSFVVNGTNIVQGFPTSDLYKSHNSPFFGETIGRVANRIKDGKIDHLNGKSYTLARNDEPNTLHGGEQGWGKKIWNGPKPIGKRNIPDLPGGPLDGGESVKFTLRSEDGDEGFPGTVDASVIYTSGTQQMQDGKEIVVLAIEYEAELADGIETIINMTNHSYFNLSEMGTIDQTEITLPSTLYLPLSSTSIPTGSVIPHPHISPHVPFTLGPTSDFPSGSFDDCFATSTATSCPLDTRKSPLNLLLSAFHPATNIHLQVLSTEPAFQFYTGAGIDVEAVGGLEARGARSGFCVEPSRFVNAVNVKEWRDQVVMRKGEKYGARIVYKAWSEKA